MKAKEKIVQYLSGDISTPDLEEFEMALAKNEELKNEVFEYKKIWKKSQTSKVYLNVNSKEDWSKVNALIDNGPNKVITKNILKIAAFAALLISSTLLIFILLKNNSQHQIQVAKNEKIVRKSLPDNSKVFLLEGADIHFNKKKFNNKERAISFAGRAYFQIAENKQIPFFINTGNAVVKVVGTRFYLESINDSVLITLEEGKVIFYKKDNPGNTLTLIQGQSAFQYKEQLNLMGSKSDNSNATWKIKHLVFENTSVRVALEEISHQYNKKLLIDEKVDELEISGIFYQESLDEIINEINKVLLLNICHKNDTIFCK